MNFVSKYGGVLSQFVNFNNPKKIRKCSHSHIRIFFRRFPSFQGSASTTAVAQRWDHRVASNVDQGGANIMAEGRKRSGPPQDSSSSQTRQRFSAPNYPDARRRNVMKAIAAALVVLGMFMTAGATPYAPKTRAPIYEPHRVSWAGLREDLHHRKAFRRTVRTSAGSFVKLGHLLRSALQTNAR